MDGQMEARWDGDSLALPPILDLMAAEPLCRTLVRRSHAADPVLLDGAAVERVSTASLQVLLAAAADARARGVAFGLHNPSGALTEALADLGLPADLGR